MLAQLIETFQKPGLLSELLGAESEPDYLKIIQGVGFR
jgi:mannitol/fructose-specific phosphotransferase system IIA component (Ntr-type)